MPRGWWDSVRNFRSTATVDKVKEWQATFVFPRTLRIRVPTPFYKIFEPGCGWLTIFKAQLICALRFPSHPFVQELANGHGLAVNQFTLNFFSHINAYLVLCEILRSKPSVPVFLQYYKIIPKAQGCFYYIIPQGAGPVKYQFTWKCLDSRKGWYKEFLFMQPNNLWGLQTS